jgi:hypothetical protein
MDQIVEKNVEQPHKWWLNIEEMAIIDEPPGEWWVEGESHVSDDVPFERFDNLTLIEE